MTRSRFHTKDPQAPGICAPLILKLVLTSYHNYVLLQFLLLLDIHCTSCKPFCILSKHLNFCHASHNILLIRAVHVYLPETLIFLTVLFELFAIWTFTAMFSPWWYNCHATNTVSIITKKKSVQWGEGEGRAGGTVPFYFKQSFSSAMSEFCISQSKILEMSIFS